MSEIIKEKLGNKILALLEEEKAPPLIVVEVLHGIMLSVLQYQTTSKNLQFAGEFYDSCKSQALNYLSQQGWE